MQMNKLYLLVALGLSAKADTGIATSSDGWYAGDCLDESNFSSTYGYVDFNCGSDCWTNYSANNDGGDGGDGGDYYGCYGNQDCEKAAPMCYYYSEDYNSCLYGVYYCEGDY